MMTNPDAIGFVSSQERVNYPARKTDMGFGQWNRRNVAFDWLTKGSTV